MEEKKNSLSVQQARISDREKDLLQGLFKDNDYALIALRNLFLGFELDEHETALLSPLRKSVEGLKLMRKVFLPELSKDNPIGQSIDLWMTLKFDDPDRDEINIVARQLLINRLEVALANLGGIKEKPDLEVDITYEGLLSRTFYISHVENMVMSIKVMANEKREDDADRILKQAKDSLK